MPSTDNFTTDWILHWLSSRKSTWPPCWYSCYNVYFLTRFELKLIRTRYATGQGQASTTCFSSSSDRLVLYRAQLNKCSQEHSINRTTHFPWLRWKKKCDNIAMLWKLGLQRFLTTAKRHMTLGRRSPQTPIMIGCCISQTKSNFIRNVNYNTKLEHAKLSIMWITSLQNIQHSQYPRVC